MINKEIQAKASKIKLLLMDCDGVLTDGRITLLPNGDEQKTFHVRDGQGLVLLHHAGLISGIISGRSSLSVEHRARELGIKFIYQGAANKVNDFEEILAESGLTPEITAFIGDDVTDIPLMRRVGLAIAVADAVLEVKKVAHFITDNKGGAGAVREVSDLILKSQQNWNNLMQQYFVN